MAGHCDHLSRFVSLSFVSVDDDRVENLRPIFGVDLRWQFVRNEAVVGVEDDVETIVDHCHAQRGARVHSSSVDEHGEGLGVVAMPVVLVHVFAVVLEPGDVLQLAAHSRLTVEPGTATEHRMFPTETNQLLREGEKMLVGLLPVQPGDLVVLTIGVVVSLLSSTQFIA